MSHTQTNAGMTTPTDAELDALVSDLRASAGIEAADAITALRAELAAEREKVPEARLAALPPEELRPILSRLALLTPGVVYYPKDMQDADGDGMSAMGKAALFWAWSAAAEVGDGDTFKATFEAVSHGERDYGDWTITATKGATK